MNQRTIANFQSGTRVPGSADFLGTGWKFPITVGDGSIAVSSGLQNIQESIGIILGTSKGERVMQPEFGCEINSLVFAPNNSSTLNLAGLYVRDALTAWEPRIQVVEINTQINSSDKARIDIMISYRVVSLNAERNLVYPFYLQ